MSRMITAVGRGVLSAVSRKQPVKTSGRDPDFKLHGAPQRCTKTPCPCERCMLDGCEEKWEHRWKINLEKP